MPEEPEVTAPTTPVIELNRTGVFGGPSQPYEETFIRLDDWSNPVTYFVGRNGSGKSKTAAAVCQYLGGHHLATDRLFGLTNANNYGFGSVPNIDAYKGIPIGEQEENQLRSMMNRPELAGVLNATQNMVALREQPDVWLKVGAFIRRALGLVIELRETAGYLDPYVRVGDRNYSLLRSEGHGLRELVVLLAAVYRSDWTFLVVDEPELHLHPSMARLWMAELERVCNTPDRRAIVVTHEPDLVRPKSASDLTALWYFSPTSSPRRFSDQVTPAQSERVTASLQQYPDLVSQLVFSPRPVLVEGPSDVAALTAALQRTHPPEVVAQTDFVPCGGSGAVALWYEIATNLGLNFKAVADLDACFAPEVQRTLDRFSSITDRYVDDLAAEPAKTGSLVKAFSAEADRAGIDANPKSRAIWLAADNGSAGLKARKTKLLSIWRDADLWLHPQGTLEDVLGISAKGLREAHIAAQGPGPIDEVASWSSYSLDPSGDVYELLSAAVERIAHGVMEALRLTPEAHFNSFVGATAKTDSRLVTITSIGNGWHRLRVIAPPEYVGYWLDFSRETRSAELILQAPSTD